MGTILGLMCEKITGHRMGAWVPFRIPESPLARFERSKCRWCRQEYVRPQPLKDIDWLKAATEIQSRPEGYIFLPRR